MRDKSNERLELLKLAESMSESNVEKVLIFILGIEAQERSILNYGLPPESVPAQPAGGEPAA
jgi:hypothetical protein